MWAGWMAAATAAPSVGYAARIQVRAHTLLTAQIAAKGPRIEVAGELRDQRGKLLPGADVVVSVVTELGGRVAMPVHTDDAGRYAAQFSRVALGEAQTYHTEVAYAGDLLHGPAQAELTTDLARDQPVLRAIDPPRRWTAAADAWTAQIAATVGGEPLPAVPLELEIDGKPLLQLRTDAKGQASAAVPIAALGPAGPHRAKAKLAATPTANAAETEWSFDLHAVVELELSAEPGTGDAACGEGDFCLRGRATLREAAAVAGLPDAVVQLFVDHRQVGALTSGADGRFDAVLHAEALQRFSGQTQLQLVARASANRPWTEAGYSPVVVIGGPAAPRWLEYGSLAVLAAAFAWAGLRFWRQRRRDQSMAEQAAAEQAGLPSTTLVDGADLGQACFELRATVLHGELGRPLACRAVLTAPGGGLLVVQADDGVLLVDNLAAGTHQLSVTAEEHEPLHLAIEVPHTGKFAGCTLLPRSCRAVVRGAFAGAVLRHTGGPVDWSRETPRKAESRWAAHLRRGRQEIRDAVRLVERALYGPKTDPDRVTEVDRAVARVDEAQR